MSLAPQQLMRFSTQGLPERERVSSWRDTFRVAEIEPLSDHPFNAEGTVRLLPGAKVGWFSSAGAGSWRRTAQLTNDGDDDFALLISLGGPMHRSQRGCDLDINAGQAVGLLHADPFSVKFHSLNQHVVLVLPRTALSPLVADLMHAATRVIPGDTEALRLLRGYLAILLENADAADPALSNLVATHIHDLAALALGATRDVAYAAQRRGMRAARLNAIKSDFVANPTLSLHALAARQRVTPRTVQMLFEAQGTSFTAYALEVRLQRVHAMLVDALYAGWTVSAIALHVGFGDLSHFNRNFRQRFGASPTEVRAAASLWSRTGL